MVNPSPLFFHLPRTRQPKKHCAFFGPWASCFIFQATILFRLTFMIMGNEDIKGESAHISLLFDYLACTTFLKSSILPKWRYGVERCPAEQFHRDKHHGVPSRERYTVCMLGDGVLFIEVVALPGVLLWFSTSNISNFPLVQVFLGHKNTFECAFCCPLVFIVLILEII